MEYTQEQFENLKRAYATGALSVKHEGKTTVFRSLNEMKRLLDAMSKDLSNRKRDGNNFLGGRTYVPSLRE